MDTEVIRRDVSVYRIVWGLGIGVLDLGFRGTVLPQSRSIIWKRPWNMKWKLDDRGIKASDAK